MLRSTSDFGISQQDWDAAKAQARTAMIKKAKQRGMIAYSELVAKISAVKFDAFDTRLFHLLGEISTEEDAEGRGMLSAIVVHKLGDQEPGDGFYELAKSLGRDTHDKLRFWVQEMHRIHAVWSKL
jgi:hypothetical protein